MRSTAVPALCLLALVEQAPEVRLKPEWGVVLPADEARAFMKPRLCNRPAPAPIEGIWIPEDAIIRQLEAVLGPALQKAIDRAQSGKVKPDAADFHRQYAGFVVEAKQIVYINGFHASTLRSSGPSARWRSQAVVACDGGVLFFGAEFGVETGTISDIVFNGGGRGGVH